MEDISKCQRTIVGLIPARSGSERVVDKNIQLLGGHPLLAYTIAAAKASGVFTHVIVSTDSKTIGDIALEYGAEVPFLRPRKYAGPRSPDIEWVRHFFQTCELELAKPYYYSILRPTNPFRTALTISNAWQSFCSNPDADSLRAVQLCSEHPYKMWTLEETKSLMQPFVSNPNQAETPWHSTAYQELPSIYVQNASLEIAPVSAPLELNTITGRSIMPFLTNGYEGYDINQPMDLLMAELLVDRGMVELPLVTP